MANLNPGTIRYGTAQDMFSDEFNIPITKACNEFLRPAKRQEHGARTVGVFEDRRGHFLELLSVRITLK